MTLVATPIYAGCLALLLVVLSARVVMRRRDAKISIGDGDDKELIKRIRVQGNCAEYVPLGILLLCIVELAGAAIVLVHGFGLLLLAGRVMHAIGLSRTPQVIILRVIGMLMTFTALILSALLSLYLGLT